MAATARVETEPAPPGVWVLSASLAAAGAATALVAAGLRHPGGDLAAPGVLALGAALVAAACLQLRYSHREHFEAVDLFDAVLAPAIFFLPGGLVVALAAMAMALSELILRTPPVKAVFNVCQWAAAAGAASVCFAALASGDAATARNLTALGVAMGAASLVNHAAMVTVFSLVAGDDEPAPALGEVVGGRSWALGGAVNLALGLLLVAAIETGAWAVALFAVPLGMLHRANRDYAEGKADRARLAGLQRATHVLVGPIDPLDAVGEFLAVVRECFGVEVVDLVLVEPGGYGVQRLDRADPAATRRFVRARDAAPLAAALVARGAAAGVGADADGTIRALLRQEGWRDCLAAQLRSKGEVRGLLCAYNRTGLESFQAGELPVLEALAAELMGALEKAALVEEVLHQARHDALTGLPNRTLFHERVERAVAGGDGGAGAAVVLLDLNRFKEVNDTLGHHHGDLLLQEFGRRIHAALRAGDTVARLGGDEFAVVIPRVAGPDEAEAIVGRLLEAVDEPFSVQGLTLDVDVAAGVALHPAHGDDAVTLLQRADVAMYAAKAAQRPFEIYAPENDRYSPRRLAVVTELRTAAARGELQVLYQPKAELRTGRITGVEALVRWRHPVHGLLPPDEFIPVAEQTGSIQALTSFVLRQALTQCASWLAAGLDLGVAVNLSTRTLLDTALPGEVASLLAATGVPSARLTLEVTETSMMTDPTRAAEVLNRLFELGVHVSIDDYGTGYSSLAHLRHLPVDEMKIDKSFVMSMDGDLDNDVIVRSTVDLGHNLGLWVVAEGVETAQAWARLVDLGCDAVQGYFLSRPVPADDVAALVVAAG